MSKSMWIGLLTAVVALTGATAAQAFVVMNTTSNQFVFHDDFESGIVGNQPATPVIGTSWTNDASQFTYQNTPAAFEGALFGRQQGLLNVFANFPQQNSGTIRVDTMMRSTWGDTSSGGGFGLRLQDASGTNVNFLSFIDTTNGGGVRHLVDFTNGGLANVALGSNVTQNTWNKITVEYTIGSNSIRYAWNDVFGTPLNVGSPINNVAKILLTTGNAPSTQSPYDLDSFPGAIPEPATLGLVALGGLMMLRRRRTP